MKKVMMLGAAILALQAVPALAQDQAAPAPQGGKEHGKMFENADTNKDGVISKEEFAASSQKRSEKHFDDLDANHDGKITKDELKAHHEAMKAKWGKHKEAAPVVTPEAAPKAE